MQEYLRYELERIASRPSMETWLRDARILKEATRTRISPDEILRARDADRR